MVDKIWSKKTFEKNCFNLNGVFEHSWTLSLSSLIICEHVFIYII